VLDGKLKMAQIVKKRQLNSARQLLIIASSKEASTVRKTQGRQYGFDRLHGSTK
jgi:hypothetical protein